MNNPIGTKVWINGQIVDAKSASINISDRGFTLGDGLFETMLWTGKELRFFNDHMARLSASAEALAIGLPVPASALKQGLLELLATAQCQYVAVRVTLTRGSGPRGLALPVQRAPLMLANISAFDVPTSPVRLHSVNIIRNGGAPSARFKTLSYIDNLMALEQAREAGCDDAVMLGTTGNIACASAANLVICYKGRNLTPAIEDGALAGIVRGRLIAADLIEEANIHPSMLAACDRAGMTNALIGVRGISQIDGRHMDYDLKWLGTIQNGLSKI